MKNRMIRSALCLALLLALPLSFIVQTAHSSGVSNEHKRMDFVAVAYTQPGFKGVAWRIPRAGRYDLGGKFRLPNDSIASIGVAPGYKITLYQDPEFAGKSITLHRDTPILGARGEWTNRTSSLQVQKTKSKGVRDRSAWLDFHGKNINSPFRIDPDVAVVARALEIHRKRIAWFQRANEKSWYGTTTDRQRVAMSDEMLKIFSDCRVDVDHWSSRAFAQMMNNFYDWRKDLNVWETACLVLNVDPEPFRQKRWRGRDNE